MSQTRFIIVAIDGGAASGKSSTARGIAEKFHYLHADTGSHYRAVTLACLQNSIPAEEGDHLASFLRQLQLTLHIEGRSAHIVVNGVRPGQEALRSQSVNSHVSPFAALPSIRRAVYDFQRSHAALARARGFDGLVMEGRDIGSVIFPEADVKIHLEAPTETRASRRASEGLADSIALRDKIDSTRATAPLSYAEGACVIDSGRHTLQEVIDIVSALILAKRVDAALRES